MRIWRVLMKLMSRHLAYHLVFPLIVGIGVEMLVAWYLAPSHFGPREYLISKERVGLYIGIMVTYLSIAALLVQKEAKPPFEPNLTKELEKVLEGATGFFATCTIPMKAWFDPYTQQYFSHLVKHQLNNPTFIQERILLFTRRGELAKAKVQYLDRHYAKPLAEIHKNYGITLGFLDRADIKALKLPSKPDFALVTYDKDPSKVYTFDKRGDLIKLDVLETAAEMAPYIDIVGKIKGLAYKNGKLRPKYMFLP